MKKEYKIQTKIYSQEKIQQAINSLPGEIDITFSHGVLIIGGGDDAEIEELFLEFMNYVLLL